MLVEIKICLSAQILIFYRHITNKSYYTNTISEYKVTVVLHQSVYEVDGRLLYVCIFFLNKPKQYLTTTCKFAKILNLKNCGLNLVTKHHLEWTN